MRLRIVIALTGMLVAAAGPALGQTPFRPVAVVNDSVITGFDLAQRAQILALLGYASASPEALRSDALDQLVEDRLKLQAGKESGITPTPEMITAGVQQYARQSRITPEEFRAQLKARGVTDQALEDMVGAQMVWANVVRARFGSRIEPGEAEIEAELTQRNSQAATEYRLREIGLPMQGNGRSPAETRALAEQLSASLNQGGDFEEAVTRYSGAPSASRAGEVGWVTAGGMPPELRQSLDALAIGAVSRPIEVSGGLSILKLEDRRQSVDGESVNAAPVDPSAREAVRTQLISKRTERLAEGLLQEMRRDALIEVR